jgi:hypothetical protein
MFQHSMDVIKVEPDSDSETCPGHLLCHGQHIGSKQEGPVIKMEVKVRYGITVFVVEDIMFYTLFLQILASLTFES